MCPLAVEVVGKAVDVHAKLLGGGRPGKKQQRDDQEPSRHGSCIPPRYFGNWGKKNGDVPRRVRPHLILVVGCSPPERPLARGGGGGVGNTRAAKQAVS